MAYKSSISQVPGTALSFLFSFLFIISSSFLFSQEYSSKNKKAIQYFEQAMFNYRQGRINEVERLMDMALEKDTNFIEVHLELALFHGERGRYHKAIPHLNFIIEQNDQLYPSVYYYLGVFELNLGNYEEARDALNNYLKSENRDPRMETESEQMLRQCEFALNNANKKVEFNPINMGPRVNSTYPEYYPCLTADNETLLYTRQDPSRQNIHGINEDFYMAVKQRGQWSVGQNIGPPINTLNNEGAPSLSVDGLLLIFTACPLYGDYGPGREGYGSCDLFFSQKVGNQWSKPRNLGPPVSTKNWETQPSFSSDGRTLYFIRGKLDGQGIKEQDIYQTYLSDSGWTDPVKIPGPINTPGHEESVFIHPDGKTLYFSSDGHPGYGGLDIYVSRKDDDGIWTEPENLGYPINTQNDENSLMVNSTGDIGYFASDRPGGIGGLDLYKFEMPADKRPEKVSFMKGKVFDAETKRPLLAKFELIDLETGEIAIESYSNSGNGEFLICLPPNKDYALNCSKENYLFYSENFTLTEAMMDKPHIKDVPMIPIRKGAKVVLNNIFFETNKYELKKESRVELDKLYDFLSKNKNVNVEIGGHTDNTGNLELNQTLSENRAKSVYDYLVQKGIQASRMSYRGYADSEPVADNSSVQGRAKNRRTEFKITGIQP